MAAVLSYMTFLQRRRPKRCSRRAGRRLVPSAAVQRALPVDTETGEKETAPNTIPNTNLGESGPLDAKPCDSTITPLAPLAQLAEQLTLNQ